MSYIHATILGIIEGLTEFLPISSTAHLILASDLMNLVQSEFNKSFEIIIQMGAIFSVVFLYYKDIFKWAMIKKLFVAFVPTAIIGLLLYKFIKGYLIGNTVVVLWALAIGGLLLIIFERVFAKKIAANESESMGLSEITYKQSFIVGLFQSIAVIPGVSRSAATIIGGMLWGVKRKVIVEFSFLLAVPTMVAATALDIYKNMGAFTNSDWKVLSLGLVVSFVTAVLAIKFFIAYIQKNTFSAFGWYRILLVIVFATIFFG
ncbi:MAG: undecaprenyl-diphosphate phosphatase [Patescibacteria group bacterium]